MNQTMMKMMTALKRKGNEPTAKTKPNEKDEGRERAAEGEKGRRQRPFNSFQGTE